MLPQSSPRAQANETIRLTRLIGARLGRVIGEWIKQATDTATPDLPLVHQPSAFCADLMLKGAVPYGIGQFGFRPTGALLNQKHQDL